MKLYRYMVLGQGIYYFLTGIWPLLDITSFMAVTGPKTDVWLVKTVGVLVMVIAFALLSGIYRKKRDGTILILGIGSAIGLACIDIVYVLSGVISEIYLADALLEILIVVGWTTESLTFVRQEN